MSRKILKYGLYAIALAAVLYNSVYFESLEEIKSERASGQFNAVSYAENFWKNELMPNVNNAVDLNYLLELLKKEKDKAFETYSNALGIGNIKYFMVTGTGVVESITDNEAILRIESGDGFYYINIATEFIFGNAVRDASGLININEFKNTMDFNNISAEINQIIRNQVIPSFKENVSVGKQVEFVGAIELNQQHLYLENIEVVPVRLEVQPSQLL